MGVAKLEGRNEIKSVDAISEVLIEEEATQIRIQSFRQPKVSLSSVWQDVHVQAEAEWLSNRGLNQSDPIVSGRQ